ncbi:hypothetical protein AB1F57_12995 [Streptococcus sp. ZY1909104]|uniref:hypothetical protein n=1 Tax=Streptococcus sp. ZY1909104 TaxID=3233335 RepID=UPI00349F39AE
MNTDEAIYSMISQRVKKRKKEKGYNNIDIVLSDPNVVTNIVNNKRYKKNKYLLTPAYAKEITSNLFFESTYTLIWGNEQEREAYFGKLFFVGIDYLMKKYPTIVEQALCYYVPFAYQLALKEWKTKYGNGIGLLLPRFDYTESEDQRLLATQVLYNHYQAEFAIEHFAYFGKRYTKKLEEHIKLFFETKLLAILEKGALFNRGKQCYDLISDSLTLATDMTFDALPHPFSDSEYRPQFDFAQSTDIFIQSLIDYQSQMEGEVKLVDNVSRWHVDLLYKNNENR